VRQRLRAGTCCAGSSTAACWAVLQPGRGVVLQVMCFPSSHLEGLKRTTRSSRRLKRLHDLLDIDITMDRFEHWPHDLTQVHS